MNPNDDKYLDLCQNIESGLKVAYERDLSLTYERCAYALDSAKVAVKQRFGYAANESCSVSADLQGILERCVAIASERVDESTGPTLKEFVARIDKIARSVRGHSKTTVIEATTGSSTESLGIELVKMKLATSARVFCPVEALAILENRYAN